MITVIRSPLASHAFNPNTLFVPPWQYDPVETMGLVSGTKPFETIRFAREEDRKRARWLMDSTDPETREFGRWLDMATVQRQLPLSPASCFYMRACRRKLLGAVLETVYGMGYCDVEFVAITMIHPQWFFKAGDLHKADPKAIRKQLRRWFERAGVIAADGFFFGALHGEFDGTGYQLHFHGIARGKKAQLIGKLYGRFGFISTAGIQHPVECEDVYDLGGWLGYSLKSYWLQKLKYDDKNGNTKRGKKQRLGKLQHEEILMWMAKQHLLSLIIYSGFSSAPWGRMGKRNL